MAVALSFTPQQETFGSHSGKIAVISSDPSRPQFSVELFGVGGGPNIEVQPTQVEFNEVAVNLHQYRRITISNTGFNVAGTNTDNLKLAVLDEAGNWIEKRPDVLGSPDFSVEWPPLGYGAEGIASQSRVDLRVKLSPASPGVKSAVVRIYANDPQLPDGYLDVPVQVRARCCPPVSSRSFRPRSTSASSSGTGTWCFRSPSRTDLPGQRTYA